MSESAVPEDLLDLLRQHVESIDQLEVLALCQQAPQAMTADEVAVRLRLPPTAALAALHQLCSAGLLTVTALGTAEFSYRPVSAQLRQRAERLLQLYAVERALVMRVLSANAIARLRAGALSAFGKKDGGER
jgi:predicted ArsR family transcriptional regulator